MAEDAAATELRLLEARDQAGERTFELANAYHNLAIQLRNARQNPRAERPARRALAIWEKVHGENSSAVANASNTLAAILDQLRKDAEAEQCARRAIAIWEKEDGVDSGAAANGLNTLVSIMRTRGRWTDAEKPARRVLTIWTKLGGPDSDAAANASNTLSDVLQRLGKFQEAEKLARNALRIWQKVHGVDSEAADNARNTLAAALDGLGRKDEALAEQKRVLEAWARRFGPNSGFVGLASNNLAWKLLHVGQVDEAEKLFLKTLDIWSREDMRPAKPSTGIPLSGLARTAMAKRDWARAYDRVKEAVDIAISRTRIASIQTRKTQASGAPSEIVQAAANLQLLVKVAYQVAVADPARGATLTRETYSYAQWLLGSQAAGALAAMASRAAGDPALAPAVRERQDLEARWQLIDRTLEAARNTPAKQRNQKAEQAQLGEAKAIESKLAELDKRLSKDFTKYVSVARIEPLNVEETQALLTSDEALVLLMPADGDPPLPEESFLWVVTRTDVRWVRLELGTQALEREVQALRCGLDYTAWIGSGCSDLTGWTYSSADWKLGKLPPFDAERAYKLYQAVFREVEDVIRGKNLLLVLSGPLTRLPLQVLVTASPGNATDKPVSWLIRDHALTLLPAVASLDALRRIERSSAAEKPMIGFGDPLLDGEQDDPNSEIDVRQLAQLARERQRCPEVISKPVASLRGVQREVAPVQMLKGLADVKFIRQQVPLPETVDELCAVARNVGADLSEIRLGDRATEREVKHLSKTGDLAHYRIVHFATHGAFAGQVQTNSKLEQLDEPGLLLTPPAVASEEDDGYLTASEIAGLRLDADWVILSACNTAAGGSNGSEALSGLARAFFYAKARALLVSHWEVDSAASVKLITGAMRRLAEDKAIGRAEAMRRSTLALIDQGEEQEVHPTIWAPFVVVGEGGTAR